MKAWILLADAASAHPDGTFSLLRGGITELNVPRGQPLVFQGAFVARVSGSIGDAGPHQLAIRVTNEDGKSVAPNLDGAFTIPPGGGATQVVARFNLSFPAYGRYTFFLTIDRQQADSWDIRAQEPPATR